VDEHFMLTVHVAADISHLIAFKVVSFNSEFQTLFNFYKRSDLLSSLNIIATMMNYDDDDSI
jgi:hypothetical protein